MVVNATQLNEAALDHILYVAALPREGSGDFSVFHGFSLNTLEVVRALLHVCRLPPTISELFVTRDEATMTSCADSIICGTQGSNRMVASVRPSKS